MLTKSRLTISWVDGDNPVQHDNHTLNVEGDMQLFQIIIKGKPITVREKGHDLGQAIPIYANDRLTVVIRTSRPDGTITVAPLAGAGKVRAPSTKTASPKPETKVTKKSEAARRQLVQRRALSGRTVPV